jgi:putative LysE/RhtB family amino acid efflux pump
MSLFGAGVALGFVLALQVGPVTLLIVRSVLRGGRAVLVGLAMAGAVSAIDLGYAALGLAGAERAFDDDRVRIAVGLVSAAVLVVIGARTMWTGVRARLGLEVEEETATPAKAFLTATAATALNPLTIALWAVSFPALAPVAATGSPADALALLTGVGIGTIGWYAGFALAVSAARQRVGPRTLAAVDVGAGTTLVVFGALLGYRTLRDR